MNKTKSIYFLSAIVLIIGCYALNLSYSMFVLTEEKEVVDSVVPSLNSTISINSITLEANEEYIIKETITNIGNTSFNYSLYSEGSEYEIKLIDKDNNSVTGILEPNENQDIFIYVKNNKEDTNIINFDIIKSYTTLYNNLVSNIDNSDMYSPIKSNMPYYDKNNTIAYNIFNDYVNGQEIPEDNLNEEEIELLTKYNNQLKLPIYNDNIIDDIEGNIQKTIDNYGISYYYNGLVDNNYVKIDETLWRIVRINGNGSIRLISNDIIDTIAYTESKSSINEIIIDNINKWYENNLKDNELLSDEIFCIDNKDNTTIKETLECDDNNIYTVLNNKLKYPIGLLQVEEVNLIGFNGYLKDYNIWTNTQYKNNEIFVVKDNSLSISKKNEEYSIRPIINIKADLVIKSGDGTQNNPYKIVVD